MAKKKYGYRTIGGVEICVKHNMMDCLPCAKHLKNRDKRIERKHERKANGGNKETIVCHPINNKRFKHKKGNK